MKEREQNQLFNLTTHFKCAERIDRETLIASELLKGSGINLVDAARITLELIENIKGKASFDRIRQVIRLGTESLRNEELSVSFEHAVSYTLSLKQHRSKRTLQDIRQTTNKLMQIEPSLKNRSVRGIKTAEWSRIIEKAYAHSPSRFAKARANLSGIYTVAFKQGWCDDNPIKRIDVPHTEEKTIEALNLDEIESLITTAQHRSHRACLSAVALMLYAGVRPDEVKRLSWDDIDWEEGTLYMLPRHTKTGGARHISLCKPLLRLLKKESRSGSICPSKWDKRWQVLRQVAGFTHWVPDVLRHSYASYHAKMYGNLPLLQLSMGHRDCQLLLTRYINLRGISKRDAEAFWMAKWMRC